MENQILQKLADYKVPENAKQLIRSTKVVFLVGVSGAGKDTIITELLRSGDYHYIVSHTTREARHNHGILEQNGLNYHFVDLKTIEKMLDNQEFVEAKLVHGNVYGTSTAEIQAAKDKAEIAISEVEVQGVKEYRSISDTVLPIFILPPSFEIWMKRLEKRYGGKIDREDICNRLRTAREELRAALNEDYYEFVINDDLTKSIKIVNELAHGKSSSQKNDQAKDTANELIAEVSRLLDMNK